MKDRRQEFRKGLSNLYLPLYDALCAELPEEWQPYCGLRTFQQQEILFAQGRGTDTRPLLTHARAGESPHNYGCASDWTIFTEHGVPVWMKHSDKRWETYGQACDKLGLVWGGGFKAVDCPHNELALSVRWKTVKPVYDAGGMDAAVGYIKKSRR